ncbi:hypothetical protein EVAR_51966_1 [Eumeta japonica]|uniref:Uncharacterized protein n=1 Tax=Eumeta variegata TaxID=151549 RepID=A0A4C1Y380_EUMVA|nr:hypothetical protein EVAR_51966_1 [Eumeta japonica]
MFDAGGRAAGASGVVRAQGERAPSPDLDRSTAELLTCQIKSLALCLEERIGRRPCDISVSVTTRGPIVRIQDLLAIEISTETAEIVLVSHWRVRVAFIAKFSALSQTACALSAVGRLIAITKQRRREGARAGEGVRVAAAFFTQIKALSATQLYKYRQLIEN